MTREALFAAAELRKAAEVMNGFASDYIPHQVTSGSEYKEAARFLLARAVELDHGTLGPSSL